MLQEPIRIWAAPNPGVKRSAKQRCCSVPAALRAPAPAYAER